MKTISRSLFFLLWLVCCTQTNAQDEVNATAEDRAIFERYLREAKEWKTLPAGEVIIKTAKFFLETPYVASTLEMEPEQLVVNLRELDCTTLVETTLALSQTVCGDNPTFDKFCDNLRNLRYRNGIVSGYMSRLHYTSDWIYENGRRGLTQDVTASIGGEALPLRLSFMSTHPDSYKQLKDNPAFVAETATKETEINTRSYYYIPKDKIDALSGGIKDGDMVCFTTTVEGLDISHVGIAHWVDGKLTFIHASSTKKEVIVNEEPMSEYTASIKSNSGVVIVRPLLVH